MMMLKVILLESHRHGHTNREVSKNPKPTVVDRSGEDKIVAELMDGKKKLWLRKKPKKCWCKWGLNEI
ncbi:Uncharacterized protein TCM_025201 [Theobroma cacao]|uniref:Uncharacterized protein n=1 Tax=Theobroma cacao TaxID=3641 RepID=A0A061EXM0_THECC|nr:Uncharacterized protein TCM_025201 [Theobroma cacao]